jgi:hypothetical protein
MFWKRGLDWETNTYHFGHDYFKTKLDQTVTAKGILGRVLTTTLERATQRLLQPHFSNGMVACLHYEHCGETSVRV